MIWLSFLALFLAAAFILAQDNPATPNTSLVISVENVSPEPGNWYAYVELCAADYAIQPGDHLEYDIMVPGVNPRPVGGVDAELVGDKLPAELRACPALREAGLMDQNGLWLHGATWLDPARDRWYHRRFDLSKLTGVRISRWYAAFEGNPPGRYVQFLANLRITRDGQAVYNVCDSAPTVAPQMGFCSGYSSQILFFTAARTAVTADPAVQELLSRARVENAMHAARARIHAQMAIARLLPGPPEGLTDILARAQALEDSSAYNQRRSADYLASTEKAAEALAPLEPWMQQFTAHLVGHAHIDLQWLWSWEETVKTIIPQTFDQVLRFMEEFPDFRFSQSSAALYLATEENHPQLFEKIRERVRLGQWEIVGGRWCEGDLNMIGPESHARHFLYAQRYFESRFNRRCTVGFEPDTFGHPWTMPQLLCKAGLRYYYFCRGGSDRPGRQGGPPLFWWEGPDGSRVLAFDESALGGWYTGSISEASFLRLARFSQRSGARDSLLLYGIGDHGGGPTRHDITTAQEMRSWRPWPQVRFSTLQKFFDSLHADASGLKIPVIRDELNPVFAGCYTTHSRIKRYNRESEMLLQSAETFATLASLSGAPYPHDVLTSLWHDLLWNHHHDTLCGSFIHASYEYSARVYESLLAQAGAVRDASCETLLSHAALPPATWVAVFNPLPWKRTDLVEIELQLPHHAETIGLRDHDGPLPVQILKRRSDTAGTVLRLCFLARDVPGCGYKVFEVHMVTEAQQPATTTVPPRFLPAAIEFEVLHEKPHAMSAWEIGEYDRRTTLDAPAAHELIEAGPLRWRRRVVFEYDRSRITQDELTYAHTPRVDFQTVVQWGQIGSPQEGSDLLKVAIRAGLDADAVVCEIPFGDIRRAADGTEQVMLKWLDMSTEQRGLTVINDCKHGYDALPGVVRLTLLRSSYDPDPRPDVGTHRMRCALLPHEGPLDRAAAVRAAWEFNQPLQARVWIPRAKNDGGEAAQKPHTSWSGCIAEPQNVIVTCLKRSEDGADLVLRAYECTGTPTTARFLLGFDIREARLVDLLEYEVGAGPRAKLSRRQIMLEFRPYEVHTLRLKF